MADWKQITARIRRARGSKDPAGQLTSLFEKTKDPMVAYELGRHFEVARDPEQALGWYLAAAKTFRRGDWKTKARDAVVRLGGELPPGSDSAPVEAPVASGDKNLTSAPPVVTIPEPVLPFEQNAQAFEAIRGEAAQTAPEPAGQGAGSEVPRGRRRGRRGGRNRRRGRGEQAPAVSERPPAPAREAESEESVLRVADNRSIPRIVEPAFDAQAIPGRSGDPGLSSRLTKLEMQLRRLLTCPPVRLDQGDQAPVGPGVFVLTDDDMSTYYHVEACDTLRIAISTLARSGASRRGNANLKPLLADHLGIPESRAAKYLADHCVVRWLQLDDGATQFAHFAIAVLRPILDE
jgi:hypothetical protein